MTFKGHFNFMFKIAISYTIFGKATSKSAVVIALNQICLIEQLYRHCSVAAIFLTLFLSVSCNDENKLMVTLQFPLAKDTFN